MPLFAPRSVLSISTDPHEEAKQAFIATRLSPMAKSVPSLDFPLFSFSQATQGIALYEREIPLVPNT